MEEGRQFLKDNAGKPGVNTTASGLQYKVLQEGTGAKPAGPTARVEVHYEGKLINGTVFDSSFARNEKIVFGLNQVIRGWTEGVQLMSEGAVYEFYIPFELAYGPQGYPPIIPPYSTLIFKVELFKAKA